MTTPHVLIIHEVEDYAAWKAIFDGAADLRRATGELSFQVLADEGEAGRIVHFSRWRDLTAARRFLESPQLAEIRRLAGVRSPRFLYLDELDRGEL